MAQGDNFKRNDLPTLQQICYLEQLKKLGNARGSVARIAETCGVYHGSVSRYFRICMDKDYLTENLEFTKKGRNWLEGNERLIKGLENYLKNIGTADQDIENAIKQMIENIDYYTLSCILRNDQKVRLTAYLEKKGESRGNTIGEVLKYGTYEVCFMLYNMENRERGDFSMANRGFRKPGILRHNRRGSYLQLERCEMSAVSRISGEKMTGHLETLKYERKGTLEKAVIKDNRLKIPLDACRFHRKSGGEIKGVMPYFLNHKLNKTNYCGICKKGRNMKILKRRKRFLAGILLVLLIQTGFPGVSAEAAAGTVYTCTIHPSYRNPVTGEIEDSGGEASYATGQGMVEGAVYTTGILELTDSGEYYLTIRMSLMDYTSNHSFWVQNVGDSGWSTPALGVTGNGTDGNGTTSDICIQVPSENCVVRGAMYVEPMGRDVIFFLYPSDFTAGNNTDMNATMVTETSGSSSSSQTSDSAAAVAPSASSSSGIPSGNSQSSDNGETEENTGDEAEEAQETQEAESRKRSAGFGKHNRRSGRYLTGY